MRLRRELSETLPPRVTSEDATLRTTPQAASSLINSSSTTLLPPRLTLRSPVVELSHFSARTSLIASHPAGGAVAANTTAAAVDSTMAASQASATAEKDCFDDIPTATAAPVRCFALVFSLRSC